MKLRNGMTVQVTECSGIDSGKIGTVDHSILSKLNGTEQTLVITKSWVPIKYNDGTMSAMTPKRLLLVA